MDAAILPILSHNMHLFSAVKKTDFLYGETASLRPGAVSDLPSGCPPLTGLVGSTSQKCVTVAGQFDDAAEVLPGAVPCSSRDKTQANLHDTVAVPRATVVTPSLQHQVSQPTVLASKIRIPIEGGHSTTQFPSSMIQMNSCFVSPFSHPAYNGPYTPIAPRPVKPAIWRKLPVSSTLSTKRAAFKKSVQYRKRVPSCTKGQEYGETISYGTKLLASLHQNSSNEISAFCRILPEHPSDILIPRTDVYLGQRLPMMKFVERDMHHPITAPFRKEDVLLGRGGFSNKQLGNLWFRALVAAYREAYHALPKFGKGQLARNLCNYVRLSGGRFLEPRRGDRAKHLWYECGDERAQAKCSQALRETSILSISDCEETSLSAGESADGSCASVE
jgi:hypothetical protein